MHNHMKHLEIDISKEVLDMYADYYRTLLTKVKVDLCNQRNMHAHGLEGLILLNWQFSLN